MELPLTLNQAQAAFNGPMHSRISLKVSVVLVVGFGFSVCHGQNLKTSNLTYLLIPCFGIFWKMRGINKAADLALDIKEMLLY